MFPPVTPELAALKPAIPNGLRHFGHGIWNKLQNAPTATTTITTPQANLITKLLVPMVTKAPDARRKAVAPLAYCAFRRIRNSRMVMRSDYQMAAMAALATMNHNAPAEIT